MKILILDQLGCYASVAAAAYLAGLVDENPTAAEIYELSCFAAHRNLQVGRIYYIGKDSSGNEYYSLGVGNEEQIVIQAAHDLFNIIGKPHEIGVMGVSSHNSFIIRLFSYLAIITPLRRTSRIIAAHILSKDFRTLCRYVKRKQDSLDAIPGISHNKG